MKRIVGLAAPFVMQALAEGVMEAVNVALIGKFIGAAALGQYSRAYGLMLLPLSQINTPISNALIPALSRRLDDMQSYELLYFKYVRIISWLMMIPIASMSIFGSEVIQFLLGKEWVLAGEIFEWLAIASFLQPIWNLNGVVFISAGQTDRMFRLGLFSSPIIVVSFIIGLSFGAIGVATCYSVAMVCLSLLSPFYTLSNLNISLIKYYKIISIPALLSFFLIYLSFVI